MGGAKVGAGVGRKVGKSGSALLEANTDVAKKAHRTHQIHQIHQTRHAIRSTLSVNEKGPRGNTNPGGFFTPAQLN